MGDCLSVGKKPASAQKSAVTQSTQPSPSRSRSARPSLASLGSEAEVTVLDGREYVILERETFRQLIEDLATMREQLQQLSTVIQHDSSDPSSDFNSSSISKE